MELKICHKCSLFLSFLAATEYHSDADYNSRRVGVVIVIHTFEIGLIFESLNQFAS